MKKNKSLDGSSAINKIRESKYSRWSYSDNSKNTLPELAINRIYKNIFVPNFKPKFKFDKNVKIFTIGSCFAREIEFALISMNIKVLSAIFLDNSNEIDLSTFKLTKHASELLNRYSVPSMYQEIMNLLSRGNFLSNKLLYEQSEGKFIEAHYTGLMGELPYEKLFEFRSKLTNALSARLIQSDVVILTLGLNEFWVDINSTLVLNTIPSFPFLKARANDLKVCFGRPSEISDLLSQICTKLKEVNPNIKILITVSPVPLEYSFLADDVILENQAAKSVLYSAAIEMAFLYDFVDYFPSYECVNFSESSFAWKPDKRHVQQEAVKSIMKLAISSYFN
jgi:hypothetical protein